MVWLSVLSGLSTAKLSLISLVIIEHHSCRSLDSFKSNFDSTWKPQVFILIHFSTVLSVLEIEEKLWLSKEIHVFTFLYLNSCRNGFWNSLTAFHVGFFICVCFLVFVLSDRGTLKFFHRSSLRVHSRNQILRIKCTIIKTWVFWKCFLRIFAKINFQLKWDSSSSGSNSYRMYGNGQSATGMQSQNQRQWNAPGPIQRPNSNAGFHQNYQQQRRINPAAVNNSGMTMNPQGKSQYFNAGSKRKDGLSLINIVVFKKSIFFF